MTLHIIAEAEVKLFKFEAISIAGKEMLEYWLEWARHKEFKSLHVYFKSENINVQKIEEYSELYGIRLKVFNGYEKKDLVDAAVIHRGLGVFLDDGTYKTFSSLDEVLGFEQLLLSKPLHYSSLVGYGKSSEMRIGKNVYIHSSATLDGKVIIGDNCTIGKDVYIKDSIIDKGCTIDRNAIIEVSHISKNMQVPKDVYFNNKVLFESTVYDIVNKNLLDHAGVFTQKIL